MMAYNNLINKKSIYRIFKLISFNYLSRIISFLIVVFLARSLSIKSFSQWQIFKASFAYLLICMDGGFFIRASILINQNNFSISSVLKKIYSSRLFLSTIFLPFYFFYLIQAEFSLKIIFVIFPFVLLSIFNYEPFAISIGESFYLSKIQFFKQFIFFVLIILNMNNSESLIKLIIIYSISHLFSFICLKNKIKNQKDYLNGKIFKINTLSLLWKNKFFFITDLAETSMQTADLLIGGLFLAAPEIAIYSIALTLAEVPISPCYALLRLKMSDYIKNQSIKKLLKYLIFSIFFPLFALLCTFIYPKLIFYLFPNFDFLILINILRSLLIYSLLKSINTVLQFYLKIKGKESIVAFGSITGASANILFNFFLIPHFGLYVMPTITILSEGFVLAFTSYYLFSKTNYLGK